ncbi:MAG: sulfite exporter TauE/SafE family protein [Gemmataceae bacterium]
MESTCLIVAIIFLATLIRSAFGFGEALVAVPLLALLIPVETAAPLAVLMSITVAAIILIQDWDKVHPRSAVWLVLPTLFGIPLGLWLLKAVAEEVVKMVLATVLIAFSTYSLASRQRLQLKGDGLAWLFGFVAGVLGGAYGMNGPPLVIYGGLRRWTPQHFRATLQGYFLPASIVGMAGYWLTGLWGSEVTRYYVLSLPAALAAIFLGRAVNRRLDGRRFLRYVHMGLIVIGVVLMAQAMRR